MTSITKKPVLLYIINMYKYLTTILFSLIALLSCGYSATPALVPVPSVSGTVSVDAVSRYVFRGISSDGYAIQPSATLEYGSAYVSVWGHRPLHRNSVNEIDLTIGAIHEASGFEAGLTAFTYSKGVQTTWEPFVGYAKQWLNERLNTSVTLYRDTTLHISTGQVEASVVTLKVGSFEATLNGTYGGVRGRDMLTYRYWAVGPSFTYAVTESTTLTASAQRWSSRGDNSLERGVWMGKVGVTLSF